MRTRFVHHKAVSMMRDRVAEFADDRTRARAFEGLGEIPESVDARARRQQQSFAAADDQQRSIHADGCRLDSLARKRSLRAGCMRLAMARKRAGGAIRIARQCRWSRPVPSSPGSSGPDRSRSSRRSASSWICASSLFKQAHDHAADIAVDHGVRQTEGDAGDGGRGVVADAGQLANRFVIARKRRRSRSVSRLYADFGRANSSRGRSTSRAPRLRARGPALAASGNAQETCS